MTNTKGRQLRMQAKHNTQSYFAINIVFSIVCAMSSNVRLITHWIHVTDAHVTDANGIIGPRHEKLSPGFAIRKRSNTETS